MKKWSLRNFGLALAAMLASLVVAPAAHANVVWNVLGTFTDGTTVTGSFTLNVYGYLSGYDLKTHSSGPFTGFEYLPSNSYFSNGSFYVDLEPGYKSDLHLAFLNSLIVPAASDPIVGGNPGPSYECQGSFSCYIPKFGAVRYIAEGSATTAVAAVPETSTWTMLIAGFAGLGFMAYRRRGNLSFRFS